MDTSAFDYELPQDRIAQTAIEPRDGSRLLIASSLEEVPFHRLAEVVDPGDLLVVNRTRVRHARLWGRRADTGGRVEVLLTARIDSGRWEALLRPARRLRSGVELVVSDRRVILLSDPIDGIATVSIRPSADSEAFIEDVGTIPLPPYFTGTLDDGDRYQTMFARDPGSSAAPTAALHFTPDLVDRLVDRGVGIADVELRIGLDTFRPMTVSSVEDHRMHTEEVIVGPEVVDAIARTRRRGGRVIAVGTTVVRSLESAAAEGGEVREMTGPTDLFIMPGYRPRVIDGLITNFHAPRTTLLVLVASLMGERWRVVYDHAIANGFRFLSFGDAMFVEVAR
jgi:S-adenosylmethionine:tRNA ribosyltransferase-isomerase